MTHTVATHNGPHAVTTAIAVAAVTVLLDTRTALEVAGRIRRTAGRRNGVPKATAFGTYTGGSQGWVDTGRVMVNGRRHVTFGVSHLCEYAETTLTLAEAYDFADAIEAVA